MSNWELKVGLCLWLLILVVWLCACSETGIKHEDTEWYKAHRADWESWDQQQLKRNDSGCPTAIFIVDPKTHLLEQC
jgi:hypothetical protein